MYIHSNIPQTASGSSVPAAGALGVMRINKT